MSNPSGCKARLRVADVVYESSTDGPGLRLCVFAQGCFHGCAGCHNAQTHDPLGGKLVSIADLVKRYEENPLLFGITLSGGEPFLQAEALSALAAAIRKRGGNVIVYTGYEFSELLAMSAQQTAVKDLLGNTDVLIDGPYVATKRDLTLAFRGSRNQNVIALSALGESLIQRYFE